MTDIFQIVRDEWCAVLGVDTALGDDDFFDLGGDSITAVTLITRVQDRSAAPFPLAALFSDGRLATILAAYGEQR